MGFTTFSTQNNIYFDLETITVYLLGDLLMTYIVVLLVCAAIEMQIVFIFNYLQHRIFGKENKYSILLLEEWSFMYFIFVFLSFLFKLRYFINRLVHILL